MHRITRSLLAIALALAVTAPLGAQTKTRLNIDDPAFNVKLYEKAVQALKDRDKDPNHKDDPNTPSNISVCPCSCASFAAGRVDVRLGCAPRISLR